MVAYTSRVPKALSALPHPGWRQPMVVGRGRFELLVRGYDTPLWSKRLARATVGESGGSKQ